MNWNKLAALTFEFGIAGYFLWCWHVAGKTKIPRIGMYHVDLTNWPRLLIGFRWFILILAAMAAAFGTYIVFD